MYEDSLKIAIGLNRRALEDAAGSLVRRHEIHRTEAGKLALMYPISGRIGISDVRSMHPQH
jgi:hypothetical protein